MQRGKGERCAGFMSADGEWANCTRPEYAGALQPRQSGIGEYFGHKLRGKCGCGRPHGEPEEKPQEGRAESKITPFRKIEDTYWYRDKDGEELFQVVRYEGKEFGLRRRDETGEWVWNGGRTERVPYRLPELLAAPEDEPVFVTEGEKDANRLAAAGLTVTTTAFGARGFGKASQEAQRYWSGRHLVIVPDADEAGDAYRGAVVGHMRYRAASIRVVELPGLEYGSKHMKDVSDWLDAGGTIEELKRLAEAAPIIPREDPEGKPQEEPKPKPAARVTDASGYNLTELGNAERLVARYGEEIRYCHPWKRWLVWDGQRWADDATGQMIRHAKATVRGIYGEAEQEQDDNRRRSIVQHAQRSESNKALTAMVLLAQSERPVRPSELDSEEMQWLLNCPNGVLDLHTGKLMPHDRRRLITKITQTPYDPQAQCPLWLAFLDRIMDGNQRLTTFLQRAIGYSLTGSTREQAMFILYGTGRNGKSTLLATLHRLLGDYGTSTSPDTFMTKQGERIPNDLAALKGARLVTAVETDDGKRLAEGTVKQVTGGDPVNARFLHGEWFEFPPELKLWLATNHKPVIRGTDDGIWRRIKLIPFNARFYEEEQANDSASKADKDMEKKLRAELPGILAWAVRGCLDWQRDGLTNPTEVQAAVESYRNDMDAIGTFLNEYCVIQRDAKVTGKQLYAAYREWCDGAGEHEVTQRRFGQQLQERGFQNVRGSGNKPTWLGIGLISGSGDDPNGSYQSYHRYQKSESSSHEEEIGEKYPKIGNKGNFGNSEDSGSPADLSPDQNCPAGGKHRLTLRRDGRDGLACRKCQPDLAK